jgi:hypothetical protein
VSEHVMYVSRRTVAAAKVKMALDRAAGRESHPATIAFANAKPAPKRETQTSGATDPDPGDRPTS